VVAITGGENYIPSMKPVLLEIVFNMLTVFNHCTRCGPVFREAGVEDRVNAEVLDEYPKELREEFQRLSDWIGELGRLYRHRLRIRIVDAKSLQGIYKSLRHHFRKYPAFIVDHRDVVIGWDYDRLSNLLDAHIRKP
jgi:hypothetical protein